MNQYLPEYVEFERLIRLSQNQLGHSVQIETLAEVPFVSKKSSMTHLPIKALSLGSQNPEDPIFLLVGGVHGLERIGSQVVLSLLSTLVEMATWDKMTQEQLQRMRFVFIPLLNPVGTFFKTRSNYRGVDLMRNAPVQGDSHTTWMVGGQRYSSKLPWFQGEVNQLEIESQALFDFLKAKVFSTNKLISLDVHSGFGVRDRLWFPYAKTTVPFPGLSEMVSFKNLLDRTYPNHFYQIEPQAENYTTHGDLWDYFYDQYLIKKPQGLYLPLTLEMGSWLWVKKNPLQLFSLLGPFNPMIPHRKQRILRRHQTLFDFIQRCLISDHQWYLLSDKERSQLTLQAHQLWNYRESIK